MNRTETCPSKLPLVGLFPLSPGRQAKELALHLCMAVWKKAPALLYSFPTGWDLTSHKFQTSNFTAVSSLLEPGLVRNGSTPASTRRYHQEQQTRLFQIPAVTLASLLSSVHAFVIHWISACCTALGMSWNDFRDVFSCLKGLICFVFSPQSQQNVENGLHGKYEKWFPCKLEVMSAKLIC